MNNSKLITNRWVRENIRLNHGPLGKIYPRIAFAMEGDTPSFLNLIPNGLRSSQSPTFGGWGGRYELYQPKGEDRPIFTHSEDTVFVGTGFGKIKGDKEGIYKSNQATIWRWREAYQNDFAARMDWAATSHYEDANHPPEIKINGKLDLTVNGNEIVNLSAEGTSDPDGNDLYFHWFQYKEAGNYNGGIFITNPELVKTALKFKDPKKHGIAHIILEVKDDGEPCLYRYARIIIKIKGNKDNLN